MADQYHFQPSGEDEIRKMQRIAVGIVVFITLMIVLAFAGCAEKEALPSIDERLQGAWVRKWLSLTNTYNFHAGACDSYAIVPAQPVQYYAYAYTAEGDVLRMVDLSCGEPYICTVSFPTDSTAVLSWGGGVDYQLTRI